MQASKDQQELSFRMAKPDVKDHILLTLSVFGMAGLLVQAYGLIFGKELWSIGTSFNLILPLIFVSARIERFYNFRFVMRIDDGEVRLERKGSLFKRMKVKPSWISGQTLVSGSSFSSSEVMSLPEEWVGGQPLRLLAALELARQGSVIRNLNQEDGNQPENPNVVLVHKAIELNLDGVLPIIFGVLFAVLGLSSLAKMPDGWILVAIGLVVLSSGIYISCKNWRPTCRVAASGYRLDGCSLTGKADGQPNTVLDLAADKLTIQYCNGLTRHFLRLGWVDDKGTFRALTHWQDKVTEDLSRIVTAAAAQGNLPEVVKWSVPK